ncbi:acyl-CoA thioester hydrolase/BAAT C-terminal domain-containing protein [Achromobacter xylosoxidans]
MVPTLSIQPADALIDVPRQIRVEHVAPGQTVEITALTRRNGVLWQSHAAFVAGEDGVVDLTRDAPVSGDYSGLSPMGLVWSQSPVDSPSREHFNHPVSEPLVTEVVARVAGAQSVARFTQRLAADGVTRQDVREEGLVGTLYLPPGATPGSHPAVLILNGSGGGINEPRAALYASRGYAAFALAYFKAPGLSDYISNTPLEYFQTGLRWLRKKVQPRHDFVAISGQSRGGELVLLLGATFPTEVSAVVAYVPGAVVHSGQNACDPKIGREGPTWLLGGKPLPHVWENNRTATWAPFDEGPAPHRHEKAILTALQDPDAVARARIKVEDIQGPVMLLSATDDGSWPSSLYSKMVQDKLAEVKHPYPVQWLDYENGGHSILFPYVPTTQLVYAHPVSGKISTSGGNPKDNARADEQSWEGVLKFLDAAVKARGQAAPSANRTEAGAAATPGNAG